MKYYILFGPPGAGKGTQAGALAERFKLCHISTGELLRSEIAAGTPLGVKAKALIDDGNLVPDEMVEAMIEAKFQSVKEKFCERLCDSQEFQSMKSFVKGSVIAKNSKV